MNGNEFFNEEQNTAEAKSTAEKVDAQKEFLDSLKQVNSSYKSTVITSACIAAIGIAVAVQFFVWLGVAIAFMAVLAYMLSTNQLLQKKLGISYKSTSGALSVTKLCAKNKEEIFIPRRLIWLDVTAIEDKAFTCKCAKNMRIVHLPKTLKEIGKDVFEGCEALETVYFEGTQEEWEKIESSTDFTGFELVFCDSAEYDIAVPKKAKKNKKAKKSEKVEETETSSSPESDTEENG